MARYWQEASGSYSGGIDGPSEELFETLDQVKDVCEWAADECLEEPGLSTQRRTCKDLSNFAILTAKAVSRNSLYTEIYIQTLRKIIRKSLPLLESQPSQPVREAYTVLSWCDERISAIFSKDIIEPPSGSIFEPLYPPRRSGLPRVRQRVRYGGGTNG